MYQAITKPQHLEIQELWVRSSSHYMACFTWHGISWHALYMWIMNSVLRLKLQQTLTMSTSLYLKLTVTSNTPSDSWIEQWQPMGRQRHSNSIKVSFYQTISVQHSHDGVFRIIMCLSWVLWISFMAQFSPIRSVICVLWHYSIGLRWKMELMCYLALKCLSLCTNI